MLRILTIVGARPQFIKAGTVSRVLRDSPADITEILVHTGQHYDSNMSAVFFQELEIPKPDYHLSIGSGTHGAQTGRMLAAIEGVLLEENPDWVLVYGDTNSTLAGALAAVKLHIPVAHIEAGLRSFNWQMPEEINRVLTDRASNLLFAPTEIAVENLRREGIHQGNIHLVGDVMYDAALYYGSKVATCSSILNYLNLQSKEYILATIHRAENTDYSGNIEAIFRGLMQVASEIPVVLPLHPRTRKALEQNNLIIQVSNCLQTIEPIGYLDMVMLEQNARLIVTDSGGVQKEAFFYRVPCVTLREQTEWVELVQSGWNRLVSPKSDIVVRCEILNSLTLPDGDQNFRTVYGTGQAAKQIIELLKKYR